MKEFEIFLNLLNNLEDFLLKNVNACLAVMSDSDATTYVNAAIAKTNLIVSLLPNDNQGGGPPPGSVVGTVTNVCLSETGEVVRALVLGESTEPQSSFPDSQGVVQPYQGGVVMSRAGSSGFTIPLANANGMSPSGVIDKLVGSGNNLALNQVVSDVDIPSNTAVVLVPEPQNS
jgi:hypothetical protein